MQSVALDTLSGEAAAAAQAAAQAAAAIASAFNADADAQSSLTSVIVQNLANLRASSAKEAATLILEAGARTSFKTVVNRLALLGQALKICFGGNHTAMASAIAAGDFPATVRGIQDAIKAGREAGAKAAKAAIVQSGKAGLIANHFDKDNADWSALAAQLAVDVEAADKAAEAAAATAETLAKAARAAAEKARVAKQAAEKAVLDATAKREALAVARQQAEKAAAKATAKATARATAGKAA